MEKVKEKVRESLKAVSEKYGVTSEAQGMVQSLPVDGVAGFEKSEGK